MADTSNWEVCKWQSGNSVYQQAFHSLDSISKTKLASPDRVIRKETPDHQSLSAPTVKPPSPSMSQSSQASFPHGDSSGRLPVPFMSQQTSTETLSEVDCVDLQAHLLKGWNLSNVYHLSACKRTPCDLAGACSLPPEKHGCSILHMVQEMLGRAHNALQLLSTAQMRGNRRRGKNTRRSQSQVSSLKPLSSLGLECK